MDYLISSDTLKDWAHLSLIQRARMLHMTFPEVKVSASQLRRIYMKQCIKYKYIKRGIKVIDYAN